MNKNLNFPVNYPKNGPFELLDKCPLIAQWAQRIDPSLKIEKVDVVTADSFGKRIGYIEADIYYVANNHHHKERIVLTGQSCMTCVLLRCKETNELFTVLVHQPRFGCGKIMYECPAGMMEFNEIDHRVTASRELFEEVGIECKPDDLIELSKIYRPSVPFNFIDHSHYDEEVFFYLYMNTVSKEYILSFEGKKCGCEADEQITLHVIPFNDIWKYANEPATLAVQLMVNELFERGELHWG
ncbi:hydrolase, NUDIX family protein [Tritrichomonas foetus]|uniref:Hydrolase, NUDIX family protein n=1 Tax=Tritrichomonas foetus TaxID=1144522 RepID=A0A1J4JFN2_9EUKA|nr:hydrolase, NUDIX family protein [Tritrichomonas foetus]|eukprot:OHS97095.1 hydrolase, NUDIX family protein [Tritrichomonas foetus]